MPAASRTGRTSCGPAICGCRTGCSISTRSSKSSSAGGPTSMDEIGLLAELIPLAKNEYARSRAGDRTSYRQIEPDGGRYTVDTPVPYRMDDLIALADSRMGKLENRAVAASYQRLIMRINTVRKNPRYAFIFDDADAGGDSMVDILCQLLRLEGDGRLMTIVQLAGFPAEVFDAIVSVLFRLAFEFGLWSDGALPLLWSAKRRTIRQRRPQHRIPAGARGAVAHRQGGPQVRRLPRAGDAAPGADRPDAGLAMQHRVRHADGQRRRPEDRARRRVRSGRPAARLPRRARHARGAGVRRRRAGGDAAALQGAAGAIHSAQRSGLGRARRGRHRRRPQPGGVGGGALARRRHEQQAGRLARCIDAESVSIRAERAMPTAVRC